MIMAQYTDEQLQAAFMKAKMAGDTERAKVISDAIQSRRAGKIAERQDRIDKAVAEDREKYSPAAKSDGTALGYLSAAAKNVTPAAGSGMASVMRAIGAGGVLRALNLPDTKDEAARLDAPIEKAPGGTTGRVIGQAAPAALAIPFTPATIPGAIAAGGITGAAMTEGDLGDRALGGGLGMLGGGVGAVLPGVYRAGKGAVKGVIEPFITNGRERIAGRTLQRFAENPDDIAKLLGVGPSVTGAQPTLAESLRSPGIAALERAMMTDPAQSAGALALAERQTANNAARLETLRNVAGRSQTVAAEGPGMQPSLETAKAMRDAAAQSSYDKAYKAGIVPGAAEAMAPQIEQLMSRPSVQAARTAAQSLAREEGLAEVPENSVRGLHYLKKALDDQKLAAVPGSAAQRAIGNTASDLSSMLEELSPLYQAARREFQANSAPVTRAEIGERLLEAGQGAIRDFGGNRQLSAQKFSSALNDEGKLIKQATGYKGTSPDAALDEHLFPWQTERVNAVRDELELLSNLAKSANGPGSHTARMLAAQNLMRQASGPLGLPEGFVSNVVSEQLQRLPTALAFKSADQRIGEELSKALLDPTYAAMLVKKARAADFRPAPSQLDLLTRRSVPTAIGMTAADTAGQ